MYIEFIGILIKQLYRAHGLIHAGLHSSISNANTQQLLRLESIAVSERTGNIAIADYLNGRVSCLILSGNIEEQ